MKLFRLLVLSGLIAVFAGLLVSSCDMPWDNDGKDKKTPTETPTETPTDEGEDPVVSPIQPILGDFEYFFPTSARVMFDYEGTYDYGGDEALIGNFDTGAWKTWVDALPQALRLSLIPQAHDAINEDKGINYRLFLRMEETDWTLFAGQNDETHVPQPYHLALWGIKGTHLIQRVNDTRFQGVATVTRVNRWNGSPPDPDWETHQDLMQFRITIEANTFFRLESRDNDQQAFRCPFRGEPSPLFRPAVAGQEVPQILFTRVVPD